MFKDTLLEQEQIIIETKNNNISLDSFLLDVSSYNTLDEALEELDDIYLEFYSNNQNQLDKALKKMNMLETEAGLGEGAESPGELGWSPDADNIRYKTIKYKGELITLVWDPVLRTWFPTIRFRSVVAALKYGKSLVNDL